MYGLFDPSRTPPEVIKGLADIQGVYNQSVQTIKGGSLSVVVSAVPDGVQLSSPSVQEIIAFKRVVDATFDGGPVIPLRFGTVVQTDEQARAVMREKESIYVDLLGRLDGQVEMGICMRLKERETEEDGPPSYRSDRPGTAYLLARQQSIARERERAEAAATPFREALEPLATSVSMSPRHDAEDPLSIAFLVPRESADAFRETAGTVAAAGVDEVEVVGPWAPYSFV
jgi:hypothetical protein